MSNFDIKNLKVSKMSLNYIKKLELVKNGNDGLTSTIYKLNDHECIKLFKSSLSEFELYRYNEFCKLNLECAVLPELLYLINNKFRAYKMRLIDGPKLSNIDTNIEYSKLLKLYKNLMDETLEETVENGIIIYDCHDENIMYDKKCDKLLHIDIGEWSIENSDKKVVREKNERLMIYTLDNLLSYGECEVMPVGTDLIDFYEERRQQLESINHQKIKTLVDFERLKGDICAL